MTQRQETPPNNLPRPLNRLIGREQELLEVKGLLPTTQLLTLTGAGGCGKTRLALQLVYLRRVACSTRRIASNETPYSPATFLGGSP